VIGACIQVYWTVDLIRWRNVRIRLYDRSLHSDIWTLNVVFFE
jgi:hypothetical protein